MALQIDKTDILIITVNEHETAAVSKELEAIAGSPKHGQGAKHLEPYEEYGPINGHRVVHVVARMGSSQSGGSRDTTRKAIEDLDPQLVLAVGIAWGAKEDQGQSIGDVLLSHQVQMGSPAKLTDGNVTLRGARPEMSATPIKLIESTARLQFPDLKVHTGVVLSRDDLFDTLDLRNKFRDSLPEAVGGEMEGQGIYEAICDLNANVQWLIVKGICDWGYKKNVNQAEKETNQKTAATAAARLCATAIQKYRFSQSEDSRVVPASSTPSTKQDAEELSSAKRAAEQIAAADAISFLHLLTLGEIDIEVVTGSGKSELVYWPVRIRRPNVVHAVQTFIAAALRQRGLDVRLCIDDLGTPEGYADIQSGIADLAEAVRKWASRITTPDNAESLTKNASQFSQFVGDSNSRRPREGALETLGDNLVKWLMGEDQLRKVLRHSKLMKSDNEAALDSKPRKLLSPAVVWTVLQLVAKDTNQYTSIVTLGGEDEKPIWRAFPALPSLSITSILLPKVDGDMDTDYLRPGSRRDIERAMESYPNLKKWLVRYGWHLPELLTGKVTLSLEEKNSVNAYEASQKVGGYFL
jgi:nucleoside phosphorylase